MPDAPLPAYLTPHERDLYERAHAGTLPTRLTRRDLNALATLHCLRLITAEHFNPRSRP
ncbi:hypothetical protein [Deinococcus sp. PEB2-67]